VAQTLGVRAMTGVLVWFALATAAGFIGGALAVSGL
jgi:hypothetical protein